MSTTTSKNSYGSSGFSVQRIIPDRKLEPWHAIFRTSGGSVGGYRTAERYGLSIVELGFADRYVLITVPNGDWLDTHCIPVSGNVNTYPYFEVLLDNKYTP